MGIRTMSTRSSGCDKTCCHTACIGCGSCCAFFLHAILISMPIYITWSWWPRLQSSVQAVLLLPGVVSDDILHHLSFCFEWVLQVHFLHAVNVKMWIFKLSVFSESVSMLVHIQMIVSMFISNTFTSLAHHHIQCFSEHLQVRLIDLRVVVADWKW